MFVFAVRDLTSSLWHPLGWAVDTFLKREDAERFIEDVRRDEPALADALRIVMVELEAGGRN
jgi:hypothetical protein